MLNSACPICIVPEEAKKHMTHSDVQVKGINGNITTPTPVTSLLVILIHLFSMASMCW